MPKEFTTKEIKSLINKHQSLLTNLKSGNNLNDKLKTNINEAASAFVAQEILTVLRSIPTSELNHEKKGIRTKALIDNNFANMADLYVASVHNIASVRGISEDTAYTIKHTVKELVEKVKKEIKIKLSTDDKNKFSTDLVKAISVFKQSLPYIKACSDILIKYSGQIETEIKEIKPATNGLRWLLTSKGTKTKAINSYTNLKSLLDDSYGSQANSILLELTKTLKITNEEAWSDFADNTVVFYNILEALKPGLLGTDDKLYGLSEDLAREIQDECFFPDGLKCTLRHYQEWGVKYILHQEKVLLGDEMGLGKTIQAIAAMVSLKNTGATHFVVICPASVVANWCREITKHSLLRATKVHGADKKGSFQSWLNTGGVAVTTYETTSYFQLDPNFKFTLLIVDEAHYIKNPEAKRTISAKELCKHADRLLFMTGTALENRVEEMIGLISILQPKIANELQGIAFMSSAPQFRDKIAPVYYRRKREEVLTELPELIESKEWCSMSSEEERVYEDNILGYSFQEARRVSWNVENLEESSKAIRLQEIVEEAALENRKVIVFSYFRETIRKVQSLFGNKCLNPINGSVNPQRRQQIIDEFDKAPSGSVLAAQIQAGGTGLNIQSASVVVICEPQLKPSIENQAISRAYRMGQSRNVLVYRLLCEGSIDERITEILEKKQEIFNAFADKSVSAQQSLEVDEQSYSDIIGSEIKRINEKRGISTVQKSNEKNNLYYNSLMKMTYNQLVDSLLSKYGRAQYDYFVNEKCSSKNQKLSRTNEGLFCHHIDEDKAILLSKDEFAIRYPFEYQKADRLVYCNFLEHLMLHIKIAEEPRNINANARALPGIGGAINFIVRQLNDYYNGYIYTKEYLAIATNLIKDDYDSYITMLKMLWQIIKHKPEYLLIIKKEDLAKSWDQTIIPKILNDIG